VIAAALESSGLSPGRLELEITESALLENSGAALKCLRDWKRLGVRLAVDDFGTGYSNLSYLSRLPLDRLKIDRSLIQGLSQDSRVAAVVRTVASLGRELGFTVLAEGVETTDQLRLVKDLGCDQAQGFLLMPPVAAAEARAVLEGRWAAFAQGRQLADVREARRDGLH
jgi:EAL domain-containing protein (putative c-di-GMP-specific phosphodiesterase class I)